MSLQTIPVKEILSEGIKLLKLSVDQTLLDVLFQYCLELDKWNKKFNLISKNTPLESSLEKHFLDSLTLLPIIDKYSRTNTSLLDIGTGAGFPGLVLKAVRPQLEVTLVEPRLKRCTFLRHIIRTLQLPKIKVKNCRLEELQDADKEKSYSFITSRALTDPTKFLPMISPFLSPDTVIILMQSQADPDQWYKNNIQKQFRILDHISLNLPFSQGHRQLFSLQLN